jgi:peptidyl-prolyl cis-trans isomerase A (cyclophilin A)
MASLVGIRGLFVVGCIGLAACEAPIAEPTPDRANAAPGGASSHKTAAMLGGSARRGDAARPSSPSKPAKRKVSAKPVATVEVTPDDPEKGDFTLEEATKGLEGAGDLVATIETGLGAIRCRLYSDKAPITVANFVGLARGLRPFKKGSAWVREPAYDDTRFHRVIPGFMIQGGTMNGAEEAGYVIPDEIWEDANHDRAGLLCMANRGKNTNSKQFFIIDEPGPNGPPLHLDGGYTIFGECSPTTVVHAIASVPTRGDKPEEAPVLKRVTIAREPAASGGAAAAPSGSAAPSASAAP